MKSTEDFKDVIQTHLKKVASKDPLFAKSLAKENKSIDGCINYILSTVKQSGCNGFTDDEIFNMAIHFYDEDSIKVGDAIKATVVINRTGVVPVEPSSVEPISRTVKTVKKVKSTDESQISLF
jgi:hypothetical protein